MTDLAALPPQALEVERQVLGACLLDPRAAERAVAQVSPAEFYSGAHRAVFGAVAALALAERKVDHHTVLEELRRQGRLEEFGGVGGDPEAAARLLLTGMLADLASPEHVGDHGAILRDRARLRRCLVAAAELARAGAACDGLADAYAPDSAGWQSFSRLFRHEDRAAASATNAARTV